MATRKVVAPVFPLKLKNGVYTVHEIKDRGKVIDQNIKMVLLTNPGERHGNLDFGVGLSRYLFEFEDQILSGADYTIVRSEQASQDLFGSLNLPAEERTLPPLRENIISQITAFIPYITIKSLDINFFHENNSITIKMIYFVDEALQNASFDLTLESTNV